MRLFATIMLTLFVGACTASTTTTTTTNSTETTESNTETGVSQTTVAQDPAVEAKAPKLVEITKEEEPNVTTPSVVVTPEKSVDGETSPQTQQVPGKE